MRRQRAVDQLAGRAEVPVGRQRRVDAVGPQRLDDLGVGVQGLAERHVALLDARHRAIDEPARANEPDMAGERRHDALGHQQVAGRLDVGAHAADVDLEVLEQLAHPRDLRADHAQQLRQRRRLRLPRAGRALVLLRHRGEQRRDEAGTRRPHAVAITALTGLRFCGIAEDAPRPAPPPSRSSPTSLWASSTTSRAIFASTPARPPSAPASAAGPVADRVPRQRRLGQLELARHLGRDGQPAIAERGQRADSAAELER